MSVLNVHSSNFDEVKSASGRVLIDFYAQWCGPCRMVLPILDEIAAEGDFLIGKINVEEESELARAHGVFSIPTLMVFEDGRVINRVTGARSKEQLLEMLNG